MATSAPYYPAEFYLSERRRGLQLIDVTGELGTESASRWSGVLKGAIAEGTRGFAVDLRSCPGVDPICLAAMSATSTALMGSGKAGVKLVTFPGSALDRRFERAPIDELPTYDSAVKALDAMRDRH